MQQTSGEGRKYKGPQAVTESDNTLNMPVTPSLSKVDCNCSTLLSKLTGKVLNLKICAVFQKTQHPVKIYKEEIVHPRMQHRLKRTFMGDAAGEDETETQPEFPQRGT